MKKAGGLAGAGSIGGLAGDSAGGSGDLLNEPTRN